MKVGFTGTQTGMTERQRLALIKYFNFVPVTQFHHGDCVGADEQAHEVATGFGPIIIVIHPPMNDRKRAFCHKKPSNGVAVDVLPMKDYIPRNHDIVDDTSVLIACPKTMNEELRSGTWATIRYARKTGKKVIILEP